MRKKAKRMKLVTAPLTRGDFIRGKAVKGEDGGRGKGEGRREMREALAHDLGKATKARFGDHAKASAEMLKKAGFLDRGTLRLVDRHHRKRDSNDEPNLYLLQLADRLASSQRADGGSFANLFLERKALPKEQLKAFLRRKLYQRNHEFSPQAFVKRSELRASFG